MALKSLRDVNGRIVAVVSVAVITAACAFAFAVGQLHLFENAYEMSGEFKDTGGLKVGQDVRVAGVKSGRITSIKPDFRHGYVVISWSINSGVDLGRGTRADVQTATLLGGRYLKISGPVARPYLKDLPASQRRIPLTRTSVPFTVTDAIQGGTDIARRLDQAAVNKLLDEAAKINTPSSAKLREMLVNVRQLSTSLNDSYPEIERFIEASKKVSGTLAAKDTELEAIIRQSDVLLRSLVSRRDQLAALLGSSSRTVRTLSDVIARHEKQLNTLLSNLHVLTTRIAPNIDALNTNFALLGPTFTLVANVKGNGNWVEGMITGLGPLQPPGPHSTRRNTGGGG